MAASRTKEAYNRYIYDFISEVYVECPSCGKRAIVKANQFSFAKMTNDVKMICEKCGYNKYLDKMPTSILYGFDKKGTNNNYLAIGCSVDPFFHLPLWLAQNCCSNVLWAYNYKHLEFLKDHVEAKLRERNTVEMSNRSLGSRLPQWIISKNNRETILKTVEFLMSKT
ncbi:MAG: hypothetical protein QM737_18945 [Ferruginibacter sp.]